MTLFQCDITDFPNMNTAHEEFLAKDPSGHSALQPVALPDRDSM
jgi:hypothetical protein